MKDIRYSRFGRRLLPGHTRRRNTHIPPFSFVPYARKRPQGTNTSSSLSDPVLCFPPSQFRIELAGLRIHLEIHEPVDRSSLAFRIPAVFCSGWD
jgi:hypothetical protein